MKTYTSCFPESAISQTSGRVKITEVNKRLFFKLKLPILFAISILLKIISIKAITLTDLAKIQLSEIWIIKASKNDPKESVLKNSPI